MPLDRPTLELGDVQSAAAAAFAPAPRTMWGLEAEAIVGRCADPCGRPLLDDLPDRDRLATGSRVTLEPGGQLEISTDPYPTADAALDALAADEVELARRLAGCGLRTIPGAVDLHRRPGRILALPRYHAMEAFFDARGPEGRQMMCNTASLQINVSHHATEPARRWRLMHQLAPVLVAVFANSPGHDADGVAWTSLRQRIWARIDPGRTAVPDTAADPVQEWARYVLDADVMLIRGSHGSVEPVAPGLPFRDWIRVGHPAGWPTADDLNYHTTTLFPPVRPRGWLELRVLDALPADVREVAILVVVAALEEPTATALALELPDTAQWWDVAALRGLRHPGLADAADQLFAAVSPTLPRVTDRRERIERVLCYHDTHVRRRLQPWAGGRPLVTRIG